MKNSGKGRGGKSSNESMGELREGANVTQTSTLRSNTFTSTYSIELSSTIPHTEGVQRKSRSGNRRDISSVIAKHSIWVSVIASLFLSAFIILTVHWVRQRRRGKLMIAPAGNKGQRSAAVIFKAWLVCANLQTRKSTLDKSHKRYALKAVSKPFCCPDFIQSGPILSM